MINALTILQIFLVLILTLLVFMQKSSSDGVANLVSQSGNNMMSRQASTNFITKLTMVIAIAFILNSIILSKLTYNENRTAKSLIESIDQTTGSDNELITKSNGENKKDRLPPQDGK